MKMIKQFAEKQDRIPSPEDEPEYPYSGYWWKAVAYTLLLGRFRPKSYKLSPTLTDVTRVCKEANFNQYFFSNRQLNSWMPPVL
jgi:hypothetical protein